MAPSAPTNGTHIGDDVTLIIDGVSRPSSTGTTYAVHNPLTGKFLHNAHSASAEDCRATVESAQAAFKEWKEWTPSRRRMLFYKAADLFETPEWQAKIKERMSSETGANSNWIHPANTLGAAANLREVGAQVTHIKGEVIPSDFPGTLCLENLIEYRNDGDVDTGSCGSCVCCSTMECPHHPLLESHRNTIDLRKHRHPQGVGIFPSNPTYSR
jgi:hypothetical protein